MGLASYTYLTEIAPAADQRVGEEAPVGLELAFCSNRRWWLDQQFRELYEQKGGSGEASYDFSLWAVYVTHLELAAIYARLLGVVADDLRKLAGVVERGEYPPEEEEDDDPNLLDVEQVHFALNDLQKSGSSGIWYEHGS